MSKARVYARSFTATWVGQAANVVVMLFLSPFVVNTLGDVAYGVWALLVSVTGYLGLVDLGVRVSTGRHINYHLGRGEGEHVSRVVNTSLVFFTAIGACVLAGAGLLGSLFGALFPKIPGALAADARWVMLLMGGNVLLGLWANTFAQLLTSQNRFDLRSAGDLVVLATRAGGTVLVLLRGGGIVALAAVQVVSGAVALVLMSVLARWKGPPVEYAPRHVTGGAFRELCSFGAWAFVANISVRIIYYTDAMVIGWFIGAKQITFYAIGLMIADTGRQIVSNVIRVVTPDVEKAGGREDLPALRWMLIRTTQVAMFIAVPLFVGVCVFGRDFVILWMGPERAAAGSIVLILALAQIVSTAARPNHGMLAGLGHIKPLAGLTLTEGALNLGLSVLFVTAFAWGINGVALGTLVPMVLLSGLVKPIWGCRRTGLPLRQYVGRTALRWAAAAGLFAGACLLIRHLPLGAGWPAFCTKVIIAAVIYLPLGVLVLLGLGQAREIARGLRRSAGPAERET